MNIVIKRKKIKNLYIRIVGDEVRVSVPKEMKQKEIELFIERKKDWIISKLNIERKVIQSKIISSNKEKAQELFQETINKYLNFYEEDKVKMIIKEQKTRWGSCNKFRRVINLNIALLQLPVELLEYVVAHEVAHLKYANHKKEFYDYLELSRPNFKEEILRLKKYTLTR